MTKLLGGWAGSMIFTAMLCALLTVLTPEGRVKKLVKLMCALAVISAVLSPVISISMKDYSAYLAQYRSMADEISAQAQEDDKKLNRTYIEEACEAYILDKAESSGIALETVSVRAEWDSRGFWYPVSAELTGDADGAGQEYLSKLMEAELGIAQKEQRWNDER